MITIQCGGGGDWEYVNHSAMWGRWIKQNIHTSKFNIIPHNDAHLAIVSFENSIDETMFKLMAPEYINYEMINK